MLQLHKTIYFLFVSLIVFSACRKATPDPEFKEGDYPRIFTTTDEWRKSFILNPKDTAKYEGLKFSPAGKVSISWKVNNKEVSTDTAFRFTTDTGGIYNILLDVTYNGLTSSRSSEVLVKPDAYTPAAYDKVVMGYLGEEGLPAAVNWDYLTHLAYQCGRVHDDGFIDFSAGEYYQKIDELITRGHVNGKPVLLSIAGRLSGIDGWAKYESDDFGDAIRDQYKRASMVGTIKTFIEQKKFDGVDIIMTDISGNPNAADNLSALGSFINELRTALPAGQLITCAVSPGYQHTDYPDLSNADWVNVHAFEDGNHVGPGAARAQSSSLEYMKTAAAIWKEFHLPANKIVIGMPAFGLRYKAIDAAGNNLDWGSFDYISYLGIIAIDPAADQKELVAADEGIYYNGVPLIKEKADYIKASDFKGAYLWTVDYDSPVTAKSLLQTLYNGLK
jgi:Glycosyl hydrolases family 18